MKTSNLAIVFTDIQGFTERTGRQTHEENRRMLRVHDNLLMPVFRAFGGRTVKTIGDAFLVVFPSPTRAVLCGVAIQDRLWDYNRRAGEAKAIHVRVAVNMGEVREERGDVFGEPVNIAARVEALAQAGEVLFTEAVYLSMNKAEVPSEDRGVHSLKGVADRVRVYRVPPGGYRLEPVRQLTLEGTRPIEVAAPPEPLGPAAPLPEGPPYGGLGLSRIPPLPPPDPEQLERDSELMPQLMAATSGIRLRATGLARLLPEIPLSKRLGDSRVALLARALPARLRAVPAGQRLVAGVVLCAVLAGLVALTLRADAVDRALARGDLKTARLEAHKSPPGADRTFAEGRIHEAEGRFAAAAAQYGTAARQGQREAFRRLVRMTRSKGCAARASAARALGSLGDAAASSALETLANATFPDEGDDTALGSIFGCSSRRAARDALAEIRKQD
jgi:class 3 adenylate cyclase